LPTDVKRFLSDSKKIGVALINKGSLSTDDVPKFNSDGEFESSGITASSVSGLLDTISGKVHVQTTSISRSTTGNFTGNYSLPSNTLKVGSIIKVRMGGDIISSASGGTCSLEFYVSETRIATTDSKAISSSDFWFIEAIGTVRTLGSSGQIQWITHTVIGPSTTPGAVTTDALLDTADTTLNLSLYARSVFSVSASNSIVIDAFTVELVD
jgi:hypothetical protein